MGLQFNLGGKQPSEKSPEASKPVEKQQEEQKQEITQNEVKQKDTKEEHSAENEKGEAMSFDPPNDAKPISDIAKKATQVFAKKKKDMKKKFASIQINPQTILGVKLFVVLLFLFIGFVFFSSNWYVQQYMDAGTQLPTDPNISTYEEYEQKVSDMLGWYNTVAYEGLPKKGPQVKKTIKTIMGATDVSYIHKLKWFHQIFKEITNETITYYNQIDTTKSNITQYGFFSQELAELMETKDNKISLQRSLLSLEVIKFTTAMKVFGLLQTFLEQFGRYYKMDEQLLAKKMDGFSQRAEIDIERYLQDCYLNPFENLKTCGFIGDFDRYYNLFEPTSDVDTHLFKELMAFIDEKLSATSFPSLAITFDRFNPQSANISFKVTVNTMQEDELQLINQGIISPHIFVVMNIINLLKQSNFILGKDINVDTMKIQTNEIEIGGKPLVIHSSDMAFSVPLQQQVQREIFDYTPDVSVYKGSLFSDTAKTDLNTYGKENE